MPGSPLDSQLGIKAEATWGTAATPVDRFYEFRSETLSEDVEQIWSTAIRAGQRMPRSEDRTTGARRIAGTLELDLTTKGWAFLHGHMLGGTVTTTGTGPYTHRWTPGSLTGKGLTAQVGKPGSSAVHPYTFAGLKVASWEINAEMGSTDPIPVSLDLVGKSLTTATALATASYTSSNDVMVWTGATVTVAGSSNPVRSVTVRGTNPLDVDRFLSGGGDTISEPLENGIRDIGGVMSVEFDDLTHYNRYTQGTEAAMVVTFARGTNSITYTMNVGYIGPQQPNVQGLDVIVHDIPFRAIGTTTDAAGFTADIVSTEVTP